MVDDQTQDDSVQREAAITVAINGLNSSSHPFIHPYVPSTKFSHLSSVGWSNATTVCEEYYVLVEGTLS